MPAKKSNKVTVKRVVSKKKPKKSLLSRFSQKQLTFVVFVLLFAAVGSYFIYRSFAAPTNPVAIERFVNKPEKGLIWDGLEEPVEGSLCFVPGQGKGKGLLEMKDKKSGKHLGCTHGPDPAPEGVDIRRSVVPVKSGEEDRTSATSAQEVANLNMSTTTTSTDITTGSVPCDGDGISGKRIQALYVRASDVPDRYDQFASSFQTYATNINNVFVESGLQTGEARNLRWVHDANCNIVVERVTLTPTGDDYFNNTMSELKAQGYTSTDRKYQIWMDAEIYCGLSTVRGDDQPGQANLNNGGPSFSRTDAGCWGRESSTEAHELMHALGAVQYTAPHQSSSGQGHCRDEWDRMCYQESVNDVMTYTCPNANDFLFDCNHDDYFYAGTPPAGNYLATHWNTANSLFFIENIATPVLLQCSNGLDDDADGKTDYPADPGCSNSTDATESPDPVLADNIAPITTLTSPSNNATIRNSVNVTASATDNIKVTRMEIYIDGVLKTSSTNGAISYTWNSKKASRGTHTITIKAYDTVGNLGQSSISVVK